MSLADDVAARLAALHAHIEDVRAALTEQGQAGTDAPTALLGDMVRALAPTAPTVAVLPAIGGPPRAGNTLTVTTGTWIGTAPITYAIQWFRDDVAIPGATGTTLATDAEDDLGDVIHAEVTATNAFGSSTASSDPVTLTAAVDDILASSTALKASASTLISSLEDW